MHPNEHHTRHSPKTRHQSQPSDRHGPIEFGGIALTGLRTELGISAIKYLRNAIYTQSATGTLILATLKHLQQEAGIGEHLLEHPQLHLSYLTPTWLTSVRQYMSNHNITITVTDVLNTTLTRTGDSFIMVPSHLTRFTAPQQRDINLVRLHLQATLLSDMAEPKGKRIVLSHFLEGERAPNFQSTAKWPRQPPPTKTQKRVWLEYISTSFLRYPPPSPQKDWARTPFHSCQRSLLSNS